MRVAEAVPTNDGGAATDDAGYQVVGPVFPENAVVKQCLGPYARVIGRGFRRTGPALVETRDFEMQPPVDQDRAVRREKRKEFHFELRCNTSLFVDRGTPGVRLAEPNGGFI